MINLFLPILFESFLIELTLSFDLIDGICSGSDSILTLKLVPNHQY